jgi:hypothetical protein
MKFTLVESFLNETLVTIQDELNPVLWSNNKLRPEVKEKIMDLVNVFQDTLDIPLTILDINIVGSNASYNYTDKSDVDVHIVTDFEEYGYPIELVDSAMQSFKKVFNDRYDITYGGYNVEVYVEDVGSSPNSNGIYSVLKDEWIKEPQPLESIDVDLEPEYSDYVNRINQIVTSGTQEDISAMISELKLLRRNSLATGGEFSKGNLIFKTLRNDDMIKALMDKRVELTSKELSI